MALKEDWIKFVKSKDLALWPEGRIFRNDSRAYSGRAPRVLLYAHVDPKAEGNNVKITSLARACYSMKGTPILGTMEMAGG